MDKTEENMADTFAVGASRATKVGLLIVLAFFGGLGGWAALAPMNGAVMAPGTLVVDSNRKVIQHLEGGIVKEILVQDGSHVKAGDVLARLDEVRPTANLKALQNEWVALRIQEARLVAERAGSDTLTFPTDLQTLAATDADAATTMAVQMAAFKANNEAVNSKVQILKSRMEQMSAMVSGLEAQRKSVESQMRLIVEELDSVDALVNQGLERKPRLLALKRSQSDLLGQQGRLIEEIARTVLQRNETELQIVDVKNAHQSEVAQQLEDIQSKNMEMTQRLNAALDVVKHLEITAPVDGTVVNMKIHTINGVISPSQPILELVPADDHLLASVMLRPEDIDEVHQGMDCFIHLTAFKQRITPVVHGNVEEISADRLTDERTGSAYYTARIRIDRESLSRINQDMRLVPGMPADVSIPTEARTALTYLFQPLQQSMQRAFREQ